MGVKEFEKNSLDELAINNINAPSVHRYLIFKSFFDFVLALIGIIITSPVLALFCLLIKLESKGPAFYTQERVGIKGAKFYVIKLRSMHTNAEAKGAQWASKDDPRVTKIGKFIRKTRIDELPQLINVLKGDMSIIGPRPERPFFTEQFENEIPGFINRLAVKPGLTGWAQVNGGYDITPKEKLEHDLFYINNLSLKIDLKIFLKTILVVFTGNGAR
ncbi:sugar transferase [Priestia filamentosa]|uniref:sugar transferase n=1 Tax=Priestia filamentosa TaxID=1402861 RepID=UPI001FB2E322|nr:sugar transferase [Priestia filamentosa]UOE61875.1 sugar transferase [Priestia filamentosa]